MFCCHLRMECTGSDCKVVTFPGEGHFFFNWRVSPGNFRRCVGILGDFLKQVGVLSWDEAGPRALFFEPHHFKGAVNSNVNSINLLNLLSQMATPKVYRTREGPPDYGRSTFKTLETLLSISASFALNLRISSIVTEGSWYHCWPRICAPCRRWG